MSPLVKEILDLSFIDQNNCNNTNRNTKMIFKLFPIVFIALKVNIISNRFQWSNGLIANHYLINI